MKFSQRVSHELEQLERARLLKILMGVLCLLIVGCGNATVFESIANQTSPGFSLENGQVDTEDAISEPAAEEPAPPVAKIRTVEEDTAICRIAFPSGALAAGAFFPARRQHCLFYMNAIRTNNASARGASYTITVGTSVEMVTDAEVVRAGFPMRPSGACRFENDRVTKNVNLAVDRDGEADELCARYCAGHAQLSGSNGQCEVETFALISTTASGTRTVRRISY